MSTQKDSSSLSFFTMDPSGKLMIKAQLGDDIRMLPLFNEDITYDELILMMQRVFKGKLSNTDDVTLKYKDEDGDLITVADTSDLNLATQRNRLLKVTIFVKGKEILPLVDASVVKDVRKELTVIRDKVNSLLDALDITGKVPSTHPPDQQYRSTIGQQQSQTEVVAPLSKAVTSFFDPLKSSPVSKTSTAAVTTASQQTPSYNSSPAASIMGAPPSQDQLQKQQQQQQSAVANATGHLFGHQSQGTAPFLTQQQQQQQQTSSLPSSYSHQQQPQVDTSYQMSSAYSGQTGYNMASNVAPSSQASYPQQQQQQQFQAPPTGANVFSQGYGPSSRYPSSATPPQAAPASNQTYPMYGVNKTTSGYQQPSYQQQQYPY